MGKTASVPCEKCGTLNDVIVSEGTFEDNLRGAAFSFACRACGAVLPGEPPAAGGAASSTPAADPRGREGEGC